MGIYCKFCGFISPLLQNRFGHICTRCEAYIPPKSELPIIEENRRKYEELRRKALLQVVSKEVQNADPDRHNKS